MDPRDARRLFAYNRWANARFFDAASALGEERCAEPVVSSFSSVRETLAHIVASEWVWLQRWMGTSPSAPPAWTRSPSLATLRERLDEIERKRDPFLATLSAEDIERRIAYRRLNGDAFADRVGDTLVHVVNHSTYHRGQLTTLLRQLGASPPSTDYVQFARETSAPV